MGGRLVGQLQLIFTIQDKGRWTAEAAHPFYYGAVVDIFQPLYGGRPQDPHGMVEVRRWPISKAKT